MGRLLNSGILHVMAGSFLAYLVASLLALPFGIKFGEL
jgi:ABC-type phosphate transport system permease subunit